jgi:hypothetical protein
VYYEPGTLPSSAASVRERLLVETADHLARNPARFRGVRLVDGLDGRNPDATCARLPAGVHALAKRTPGPIAHPIAHTELDSSHVNAFYESDPWTPPLGSRFPEYQATTLTEESFARDLAPIATPGRDGVMHGRSARRSGDTIDPCPVWIIGEGMAPAQLDPDIDARRAMVVKTKIVLRQYAFYLNKGAERVMNAAISDKADDRDAGILSAEALAAARKGRSGPSPAGLPVGLPLEALGRVARRMGEGIDREAAVSPLEIAQLWDCHDHVQFAGDGTRQRPSVHNRDLFTFLPFQVNASRRIAAYYVMTRDVTHDLAPEAYGVKLRGVSPGARVSAYDPVTGDAPAVRVLGSDDDGLAIELQATDTPRLLVVDER